MSLSSDWRNFLRELDREGYTLTETNKQHIKVSRADMSQFVIIAKSPRIPWREMRNTRALIRQNTKQE